ncbi:MAG: DoxX family membrane protein [Phycisphaeraceae bacterium]|nr:DoxX family membrane protein [Phycisphaeraceae bacterium]
MSEQAQISPSKPIINSAFQFILTVTRFLIGWHFLYEGITKLLAPHWTSAGYLMQSHWYLSDWFHWIAQNPDALRVVDLLNMWGLVLIGLGLFVGAFTRISALSGASLLLLYYIANPPLTGFLGETTSEGHYLIVNKNLIEMVLLLGFVFVPRNLLYGMDRWVVRCLANRRHRDAETKPVRKKTRWETRRELLRDVATLPLFGGLAYSLYRKRQWESFEERHLISKPSRTDATTGASPMGPSLADLSDLSGPVPKGKIGDLNISRLMCGGNLISGYAHSRDLIYVSSLVQNYFSDEKVLETMHLCEASGINTIILRVDKNTLRIVEKYRKRGGRMQWIAQSKITEDDIRSDIDAAVDCGAVGAYIHGGVADSFVAKGKVDLLGKALEHIKQRQVLAGIAGHDLRVIMASEEMNLNPDFYLKTLNSGNYWTAGPRLPQDPNWTPGSLNVVEPEYAKDDHDNIWSVTPQQTIEFMKQVKKPWIAYKVLGAGAIDPKDGFQYAFENGADFICVGMFDFQIVPDANITNRVLAQDMSRIRPWQG